MNVMKNPKGDLVEDECGDEAGDEAEEQATRHNTTFRKYSIVRESPTSSGTTGSH